MGTFEGHVVPGVVFILFGLWHVVQFMRKYFGNGKKQFVSNTYYDQAACISNKIPCESVLKIVATSIHITIETVTGFDNKGKFVHWGNVQHMASLCLFFVQGVTEIGVHNKFYIPPDINYVSVILAFLFEAFIFSQHLHGRPIVEVHMHVALVILALITALLAALEMRNRNSVTLLLVTRYFIVLQGTWLVQMGFVLFPPSTLFHTTWTLNDHMYNELLSATLGFQAAAILLFIVALWLCFAVKCGKSYKNSEEHKFDRNTYSLLNGDDEQQDD